MAALRNILILHHVLKTSMHTNKEYLLTLKAAYKLQISQGTQFLKNHFLNQNRVFYMRVQTEAIHFSADAKLLASIEKKISRLVRFFENISDVKVILKLENSGQVREKIAEIKLVIPNGIIFIKETSKTFEAAIDAAVLVLKRQLVKHKERKTPKLAKKPTEFINEEA